MINELIYNFLFGGILFSSIYYASNILKNPFLSALCALLPLSIVCGYIINNRNLVIKYYKNIANISVITLIIILSLFIFSN